MSDPFDTAELFSTREDEDHLSYQSPEEAIAERFDYGEEPAEPVTVYAWKRKPLPVFTTDDADHMLESHEEHLEEWCNSDTFADWHIWQGDTRKAFLERLVALFAEFAPRAHHWAYELVASREYSAEEVAGVLAGYDVKPEQPGALLDGGEP